MKAKEYAAKYEPLFRNCESLDVRQLLFTQLFKEFMQEVDTLKNTRHITTRAGLISLLNEASQKWRALAALLPDVNPEGFRNLWAEKIPEIAKELR